MLNHKKYFDLNFLLRWLNVFLCFLGASIYIVIGGNQYVDANTIFLFCILCIVNLIFLFYEKRNRDAFIMILAAFVTIFYVARIVTLLYVPYSVVLNRNTDFSSSNMNYVLLFIILSNIAIFLGIVCAGRVFRRQDRDLLDQKPFYPSRIVILLLLGIIVTFSRVFPENIFGRFSSYVGLFLFNIYLILLFVFVYLMLNYENIPKPYRRGIICLLVIYVISHTLIGSRQSLLVLITLFFIASLAVKGCVKLPFKLILMFVLFIPIAVILFVSATYIRLIEGNRAVVSLSRLNLVVSAREDIFSSDSMIVSEQRIFDRIGYLDYSADAIVNKDRFRKIVNFSYYFKSIVDNCFTPGFDVFDTPMVAHAMRYITYNLPEPSHEDIRKVYQADMITLYGDYYILFGGYPALVVFFAVAFFLKTVFNLAKDNNLLFYYLERALILYIFYLWLIDFGIDWMVLDLIKIAIMFVLFAIFYKIGRKRFIYSHQSIKHST